MTADAPARPTRRTELDRYPDAGRRYLCLGIVVVATIVLYYQFYLSGAVTAGTKGKNGILVDYDMSFLYYLVVSGIGAILGALGSFATGIADKVGRVNIITGGLVVVALLCLFAIPLADSKLGFGIVYGAMAAVEGAILVATPALIRDFSPQLGRASAMGFWTLGPVLGSLVVSIQTSSTSNTFPWHHQYVIAGIIGLVVAVLSFLFLRELTPQLRDQIMVRERDRVLVEARAKGIDVEAAQQRPFRQMLKPDIVLSALAISLFLIIYFIAVGFFPVYFETIFGYSQSKANALGNWVWAFDAGALIVVGFVSDKTRVRKPFMIVGAIGGIVLTSIFATRTSHPETSYSTFVLILVLLAVFLGMAYAPWMASFTETVEARNPALTATGLAVWGLIIRIVVAASVFIVPALIDTVTTLVSKGPQAQAIAAKYPQDIATAQKIDPATSAALAKNPADQTAGVKAVSEVTGVPAKDVVTIATLNAAHGPALQAAQAIDDTTITTLLTDKTNQQALAKAAQEITTKLGISAAEAQTRLQDLATIPVDQLLLLKANGQKVLDGQAALVSLGKHITPADAKILQDAQQAAEDSPAQWQHYFWIAVGGQVIFIPLIFLLTGCWSPKRARKLEEEHEAMVQAELAKLQGAERAE